MEEYTDESYLPILGDDGEDDAVETFVETENEVIKNPYDLYDADKSKFFETVKDTWKYFISKSLCDNSNY